MTTERERIVSEIMRDVQGYYATLVPDRIREAEAVGHVLGLIDKHRYAARCLITNYLYKANLQTWGECGHEYSEKPKIGDRCPKCGKETYTK